jgi:ABC-2 type transport system permease protein
MRPTLTLFRREFMAYFTSPVAYILLVGFLFVFGAFFFSPTLKALTDEGPVGVEWPMQRVFGDPYFWLGFLIIPAALTMRSFAEERGTGTLEMLLTVPLRDWQVVLAKFAACLLFYLVLWLPTLACLPVLLDMHGWNAGIDRNPVLTTYLGLALVGAMLLSIGLFISSLVKSQLVAVLLSLVVSLLFVLVTFLLPFTDPTGTGYKLVNFFAIPQHFNRDFTRGLVDSRNLVLYVSV